MRPRSLVASMEAAERGGRRRDLRHPRRRVRPVEPGAGHRRERARGRRRPAGRLRRAPAPVRLAPGHAPRRRHHAGLVPQGPGDPAQPGQRLQLPLLPARARPAHRLHQPQEPVPAAGRVPRLPRVGRGPGRAPGRPTTGRHRRPARRRRGRHRRRLRRHRARLRRSGHGCAGPATWWWPSGCRRPCPPGVTPGPRVWHNLDLLRRVEAFPTDARAPPLRGGRRRPERGRGGRLPPPARTRRRGLLGVRQVGLHARPTTRPTPTASSTPTPSTSTSAPATA